MKAFILTAGLGTRLRPFTEKVAKPAIEFLTLPMFAYSTYPMEQMGINDFIMNTHHLPETLQHTVNETLKNTNVSFSHEPEILGSAGGIGHAKNLLSGSGDFFVLNGDTVNLFGDVNVFSELKTQHDKNDSYATLLLMPHPEAGKSLSAAWVNPDGSIAGFGKSSPKGGAKPYHFVGSILFAERSLADMPTAFANTLTDVIMPAAKRGERVDSYICESVMFGETGNISDYLEYQKKCLHHLYANDSWGKYLRDILNYYRPGWRLLDAKLAAEQNLPLEDGGLLLIHDSSQLILKNGGALVGHISVGPKCCVEANSSLDNVSIGGGVHLKLSNPLSNSIIL
ncbi:MAG: sugar phosphate nucleotidyltransferase [Bdellovibrionales bacterium]